MGDQYPALGGVGLVFTTVENNIAPNGECSCLHRLRSQLGLRVCVNTNLANLLIEVRFKGIARRMIHGLSG